MKTSTLLLSLSGHSLIQALPQGTGPYKGEGPKPGAGSAGAFGASRLLLPLLGKMNGNSAWETDKIPDVCQLGMGTEAGGNCWAFVNCQGDKREYKSWSTCYLDGNQYFSDPRIGDFSIKFTTAGGKNSKKDGLHGPVIALKNVGPWEAVEVEKTMVQGKDPTTKGKLCRHGLEGDRSDSSLSGKKQAWLCGVPKVGTAANGATNNLGNDPNVPLNGGSCGIHVTQYQIPKGPNNHYSIEVDVKDGKGLTIGYLEKTVSNNDVKVTSKLKDTLIVSTASVGSAANTDEQPVKFELGSLKWDSNDKRCSVGGYDNDKRQMDCGFPC